MCRFWALRPRPPCLFGARGKGVPPCFPVFIQKSIYESFLCISRVRVPARASAVFRFFAFTLASPRVDII